MHEDAADDRVYGPLPRPGQGPQGTAPWPRGRTGGPGRVPRVAKLLALAHRFAQLLHEGVVKDYAALGRLGHVSRARVSQIMALLCLASDLQEEILLLSPTVQGRDRVQMRHVLPIAAVPDWKKQRQRWRELHERPLA